MQARSTRPLESFVRRLLTHSRLGQEEQKRLLQIEGVVKTVVANRELVHPGTRVNHATLVLEGVVGRYDPQTDGGRAITAVFIPGDICDLVSVATPKVTWGLLSLSRVTHLSIPLEQLRTAAVEYPAIALAFWADTILDASILSKLAVSLGRHSAQERVAHFLCELGMRFEQAGVSDRTNYPLPVSQPNLSDCVGMTPVHLNRSLKRLEGDGLLDYHAGRIRILEWESLVTIGDFSPDYLLRSPKN